LFCCGGVRFEFLGISFFCILKSNNSSSIIGAIKVGIKLGILGLGTVGTGTVELLQDCSGRHPLLGEVEIHRVGVRSLELPRAVKLADGVLTTDLELIVNDPEIDIIVEVMGGLEPARELILKAIQNGKHVVTANKAVISRFGDEIFTAANKAGVYVMVDSHHSTAEAVFECEPDYCGDGDS
jgi:homoserine dehydrogenase